MEWAQCSSERDYGGRLQKLGIAIRCWNGRPQDADRAKNLTRFKKELDVCLGVTNRGSCQDDYQTFWREYQTLCFWICAGF